MARSSSPRRTRFLQDSSCGISAADPSILGNAVATFQIRLPRISPSIFHLSDGTLPPETGFYFPHLSRVIPDNWQDRMISSEQKRKKEKNSDRGGSSLGGERERERGARYILGGNHCRISFN